MCGYGASCIIYIQKFTLRDRLTNGWLFPHFKGQSLTCSGMGSLVDNAPYKMEVLVLSVNSEKWSRQCMAEASWHREIKRRPARYAKVLSPLMVGSLTENGKPEEQTTKDVPGLYRMAFAASDNR